jgi:predicted dehydrogenase
MAALRRGKHVYCEKPLTHSVWEARTLAQTARAQKVATQMGNQGQAGEGPRRVREYIQAGAIGTVREVHHWTDRPLGWWAQGIDRPGERPPVPDHLDWDLWLGPAPERPYHPAYHPFAWRGWWDFGTGALGDMGCHAMDPIFRALDLRHPITVEASSTECFPETAPLASMVHFTFAAGEGRPRVKLNWYDGGLKPRPPDALEPGMTLGTNGVIYVGDEGVLFNETLLPKERRESFTPPPKTLPRSPGHHREWIDACKGGAPAGACFDFAGPLTEAVLLGNVAIRIRKKLCWDPEKLEITNVPEANPYLRRAYRKGWEG